MLFVLSFATSYAALYGYALHLEFGREFAIVSPLVLDAVISVLAVTVLLERGAAPPHRHDQGLAGDPAVAYLAARVVVALLRWERSRQRRPRTVDPAPQFVAAVPPVSAALTFHLLLRLLDRAPALRMIAFSPHSPCAVIFV